MPSKETPLRQTAPYPFLFPRTGTSLRMPAPSGEPLGASCTNCALELQPNTKGKEPADGVILVGLRALNAHVVQIRRAVVVRSNREFQVGDVLDGQIGVQDLVI